MKLGRNLLPTLVVGSLLLSANIQAQEVYRARLSPMPTTPQTVTTILGEGEVILTLNGNSLTVEGNFSGMSSAATGAHIHNGPPAQPGPVIHTLEVLNLPRANSAEPYHYRTSKSQPLATMSSCLLYTSPSPRDGLLSRMPSSA